MIAATIGRKRLSSIPNFRSSNNKLTETPTKAAAKLTKIKTPKNEATIATAVPSTDFRYL